MRIKRIKDMKKQQIGIVAVILLPVVLLGTIFGTASYLYVEIPSFGMDESKMPAISTFIPGDYDYLAACAAYYDQRFEDYNLPFNYTVAARFTDESLTTLSEYVFTDNGALWSGTAIAAYVGKYLAARREANATMTQDALRVIRKLVHGMSMMLAVPNGGLGPDHGAILARMWAPPENATLRGLPLYNSSIPGARSTHAYYNGTGIERDIEDQLARFTFTHLPDVNGNVTAPGPEYRIVDFTKWQ
ncbi:MAG: hypothetical protein GYA24_13900, partial [Candidatus Lokiarchaeota archaeon]|nr:hypothetical protein [Candidatus Lokiarchaeota archaeon]